MSLGPHEGAVASKPQMPGGRVEDVRGRWAGLWHALCDHSGGLSPARLPRRRGRISLTGGR